MNCLPIFISNHFKISCVHSTVVLLFCRQSQKWASHSFYLSVNLKMRFSSLRLDDQTEEILNLWTATFWTLSPERQNNSLNLKTIWLVCPFIFQNFLKLLAFMNGCPILQLTGPNISASFILFISQFWNWDSCLMAPMAKPRKS